MFQSAEALFFPEFLAEPKRQFWLRAAPPKKLARRYEGWNGEHDCPAAIASMNRDAGHKNNPKKSEHVFRNFY